MYWWMLFRVRHRLCPPGELESAIARRDAPEFREQLAPLRFLFNDYKPWFWWFEVRTGPAQTHRFPPLIPSS